MGKRLSKIYTRTGDDGTTGLGDGTRVAKDSVRVDAYGTVDEANSAIGVILACPSVPQIITLSYTQDIGQHRLGVSVIASGDREDFGGIPLAGYVLANLTGLIRINDDWSLNARIENLLDTEYETAANFRMQERSGFIELRYRWK